MGVPVEVWHADHAGRYASFAPLPRPRRGHHSASVPNEIVAPSETFLRGMQRTDPDGMCMFETIYPGWYASRTVHIHVAARPPTGYRAVSQVYFPDELTDEVFTRPPYAGRPRATPPMPPTASSRPAAHAPSCSSPVTQSAA